MGLNDHGQLGHSPGQPKVPVPEEVLVPERIVAVAAGYFHTLALAETGNVWAWGLNDKGQLGIGQDIPSSPEPRLLKSLQGEIISNIAAGMEHCMALSNHGEVFSWGSSEHGRLGHGQAPGLSFFLRSRPEYKPRRIRALETHKIKQISAGQMHSACINHEGQALMWGNNRFWALGLQQPQDYNLPTEVSDLASVAQLSCGGLHSVAVRHSGEVEAWGANQHGVLGQGHGKQQSRTPVKIPGFRAEEVSAGWKHCAAVASGRLHTWGWGGSQGTAFSVQNTTSTGGQLGLGDENDYWSPTCVELLMLSDSQLQAQQAERGGELSWRVLQVSCGLNHTAAVVELAAEVPLTPAP